MLRFFRRLRQRYLSKSSRKYLLYAAGEVLLIVVGVLIALSINNWNDEQTERDKEIEILSGIKENLLLDTIDINVNINSYMGAIESDSILLRTLITGAPYDSLMAGSVLALFFSELSLVLHQSAYLEARDQGLQIISNEALRAEIRRLYEFDYPYLLDIENEDENLIFGLLREYLSDRKLLSYRIVGQDELMPILEESAYADLVADKNFQMCVALNLVHKRNLLSDRYRPVLEKVLNLIRQIDDELERLS